MFKHSEQRQWYETYWALDIHGVISKPDYRKGKGNKDIQYYPYAKETLQLLSKRDDIKMFMFTSSYPEEIVLYSKIFEKDGINFRWINENPDISDVKGCYGFYEKKPYYNCLFEDKRVLFQKKIGNFYISISRKLNIDQILLGHLKLMNHTTKRNHNFILLTSQFSVFNVFSPFIVHMSFYM